jgi:ParB family transcriptional regulator, chromosome partitioning protein
LKLPAVVREDITSGKMTMGHARALLALEAPEDQLELRELIVRKKLSVRDTERKAAELIRARKNPAGDKKNEVDANIKALEEELMRIFGAPARIVGNETRGFVQFTYATRDDLMRLVDKLKGQNAPTH